MLLAHAKKKKGRENVALGKRALHYQILFGSVFFPYNVFFIIIVRSNRLEIVNIFFFALVLEQGLFFFSATLDSVAAKPVNMSLLRKKKSALQHQFSLSSQRRVSLSLPPYFSIHASFHAPSLFHMDGQKQTGGGMILAPSSFLLSSCSKKHFLSSPFHLNPLKAFKDAR